MTNARSESDPPRRRDFQRLQARAIGRTLDATSAKTDALLSKVMYGEASFEDVRSFMQAATKILITLPANRRAELQLPVDPPVGPAEVIVLVPLPDAPTDGLVAEGPLDAGADAALGQDGRFRTDGGLVVFRREKAPELHRQARRRTIVKSDKGPR